VVGVKRSTSETARRTSKWRKIKARAFLTLQRRGPQGRAHIWNVFPWKSDCWGPSPLEWDRKVRPVGPSRRVRFWWCLIKNAKFYPSSSRHRVFPREPIHHPVVVCPISNHSIAANRITTFPCAHTVRICSKIINNYQFLENRKKKYGGNMCNQFFDPGFLFDFYSYRGSKATPSARSNVSWCGLWIFSDRNSVVKLSRLFPTLIANGSKTRRARVLIFGTVGKYETLYSN